MSAESKDFCAKRSFGELLRLRREQRNESLQDVADAIGTTKGHMWQLETGSIESPRLSSAIALAGHFGCSVDELAGVAPTDQLGIGVPDDVLSRIRNLNQQELEFLRDVLDGISRLRPKAG